MKRRVELDLGEGVCEMSWRIFHVYVRARVGDEGESYSDGRFEF